jgi:hypothetical protein
MDHTLLIEKINSGTITSEELAIALEQLQSEMAILKAADQTLYQELLSSIDLLLNASTNLAKSDSTKVQ